MKTKNRLLYKPLDFYLERRKTRSYVGRLSRQKGKFVFEYDKAYLYSENPIAIGPDLPLKKARHVSLKLFPSFADRIPSQKNPAYKEYCRDVGLSPFEKDPFMLLSAFGKKSPITPFVFEPVQEQKKFSAEDLRSFRKSLGLSIREFANLFDISSSTVYRIENNKTTGRDVLKKIADYFQYPKMTLDKIKHTGKKIQEQKKIFVEQFFQRKIMQDLYAVLNELTTPDFLIEHIINDKIREFIKETTGEDRLQSIPHLFFEKTAFSLIETWQPDKATLGWEGLHYVPPVTFTDKETGNLISNPNIKDITPEMINYWEKRSDEVKSPILQYRYGGLVWDFSKKIRNKKPDIVIARRFIDSAIQQAEIDQKSSHLQKQLERALRLAISLDDKERVLYLRDIIIKYEKKHSEDDKAGTWGYSYDLLIGDKNLFQKIPLEKKQEKQIIEELERKLKCFSAKDPNTFDSHSVELIVVKLAPYYKNKNDQENMKRVLLIYRDSFLHGPLPIMIGATMLKKVEQILRQYGLSEEAKELEPRMRDLQKESLKELKPVSVAIPLPQEQIQKKLDKNSLSEALLVISTNFIPDKKKAQETVCTLAKEHPIRFMFSHQIMDHTGRTTAEVGPIKDDLEGHIVQHISQEISYNCIFIDMGLSHLQKTKSLNAHTLSEHLLKSPVFPEAHHQIIKEGLKLFFDENYIASCSILLPQIESAIRHLIAVNGGQIYQTDCSPKEKGFELRPFGALIRDPIFTNFFKNNISVPDYFQVLFVDKRGLNIRNMICHGHFPAENFNRMIAVCVIHALLVLSLVKKNIS